MSIDIEYIQQSVTENKLVLPMIRLSSDDITLICNYLNVHPEITTLDLGRSSMMVEVTELLADNLSNTSISSLLLGGCYVGDEGAIALAKTRLTLLDLTNTKVGAAGIIALAANTSITSLILDRTKVDLDAAIALAKSTSITSLSLIESGIGDDQAVALAESTNITSLKIGFSVVTDLGAMALAKSTSLTSLTLDGDINDLGTMALAKNTSLTSLKLPGSDLTDKSFMALKANFTLTSLELFGTVDEDSKSNIKWILERNRNLPFLREKCLTLAQGYNDQNSFFKKEGIHKEVIDVISAHTAIVYGV